MEASWHYKDLEDRQSIITMAEGIGYRMTSDTFDPDWEKGDEPHGTMVFTDEPSPPPPSPEPPKSTHYARVTGFTPTAVRPLSVVRTWNGQDFPYDCFVTQDLVDAYIAGKLVIGDWVLIHFDDCGEQIAMMKIYTTW